MSAKKLSILEFRLQCFYAYRFMPTDSCSVHMRIKLPSTSKIVCLIFAKCKRNASFTGSSGRRAPRAERSHRFDPSCAGTQTSQQELPIRSNTEFDHPPGEIARAAVVSRHGNVAVVMAPPATTATATRENHSYVAMTTATGFEITDGYGYA